jgi:hypothetical protein
LGKEGKKETKVVPMKKLVAADDSTAEETLEEEIQADSQVSLQMEHQPKYEETTSTQVGE